MRAYLCISCNQPYNSDSEMDCPNCGAGHLFQCVNEDTRFNDGFNAELTERTIIELDGTQTTSKFMQVDTWESYLGTGAKHDSLSGKVFHNAPKFGSLHRDALAQQVDDLVLPADKSRKVRFTNWRKPVFEAVKRHGDFSPHMVRAFTNICEQKDYFTALSLLQAADERLRRNGIRYTRNDEEIKELAKAKSKAFHRKLSAIACIDDRFEKGLLLIGELGLTFREDAIKSAQDKGELESLCNRMCCEHWLRRQLRRVYFSEVEAVARDLMLIHKSQDAYCSSHSVKVVKERQSDTEQSLINTVCYLEEDQETWFTLQEQASKSISNPLIRRAEMFVRLKAFEEIAQDEGHIPMFYTVTAPSRFHVYKGNSINPKWEQAGKPTTLHAHKHLMGVSDAFRKAIDKADIKIYGLRIVEPHHDGTPHHHYLYFMRPEDQKRVTELLRNAALADCPTESGAKKYRFKSETIDWDKGSAVGYIAKYISKNIDGANIDTDKSTDLFGESGTGRTGSDAAERVVSFNRLNNIRQFQFIGGPSITTWREMRRFREEFKEDDAVILGNELSKEEHFVLENIRKAADEGDFKRFVMAMGGVFVKRGDQTVRPAYAHKIDVAGLIKTTRYGDEMSAAIEGILFKGKTIKTRFKEWRFASKKQFVLGIRTMMKGTKMVFETLEEEGEYWAMKIEEYERMSEEAAFYLDMPSIDPSFYFDDAIHAADAPPDWLYVGRSPRYRVNLWWLGLVSITVAN